MSLLLHRLRRSATLVLTMLPTLSLVQHTVGTGTAGFGWS